MNGQLRGRGAGDLKAAEHASDGDLKRASKATKDLTQAIKDAPPLKRDVTVHRALSASQFAGAKPGDVISDKGFTSTAIDRDVSMVGRGGGQVTALIRLPAGTHAAAGSSRELVLPPGARFKVSDVDGKGNLSLDYLSDGEPREPEEVPDSLVPAALDAEHGLNDAGPEFQGISTHRLAQAAQRLTPTGERRGWLATEGSLSRDPGTGEYVQHVLDRRYSPEPFEHWRGSAEAARDMIIEQLEHFGFSKSDVWRLFS